MPYDVTILLDERMALRGDILLEGEGYTSAPGKCFECYDRGLQDLGLLVETHSETGELLFIQLLGFKDTLESAVKALRENPLPWVFTVPQMGIRGKPLEDVLIAIWKKYRGRT